MCHVAVVMSSCGYGHPSVLTSGYDVLKGGLMVSLSALDTRQVTYQAEQADLEQLQDIISKECHKNGGGQRQFL